MLGFMLSMSDLMIWAKHEKNIPIGPSRGSVAGSRAAFVTDIIDVDPVRWNLVFSRFCNETVSKLVTWTLILLMLTAP